MPPVPRTWGPGKARTDGVPQSVLLWPDTWNNYYHPQSLQAAETVLTLAGFRVETPRGHICCGRPLYDFGLLSAARSYLAQVLRRMAPQIDAGLPFIFLEPSCASVFKDELLELFPSDPRAKRLSEQVWLLADLLAARAPGFVSGRLEARKFWSTATAITKRSLAARPAKSRFSARLAPRLNPSRPAAAEWPAPSASRPTNSKCRRPSPTRACSRPSNPLAPTTIIVADGFSCREQIDQLAHAKALHFAEVLAHSCHCEE